MKGMGEYNLFDLYKNGVLAFERIKGDVKETYTFTYDGENINRFWLSQKTENAIMTTRNRVIRNYI